jgi:hypothetical protein
MAKETLFERLSREALAKRNKPMDLFHRIDDAEAIVRLKGGVYKQTELYHRKSNVYVKHGAGFVRLCAKLGDKWGTSAPGVDVIDITEGVPGLTLTVSGGLTAPSYRTPA